MSEIKKVYHKKSKEVGYKWKNIVFVIDMDLYQGAETETEILKNVVSWLEFESEKVLESIEIVFVDPYVESIDLYFEGDIKYLVFKPDNFSVNVYANGLLPGTKHKKSIWKKFGNCDWTEQKPVDWGKQKKVWKNLDLDRKDIWGD